mgnify:CR=1 FL=1|tara:strand:+ start:912 stop:1172 length:261 start_codon:yes stop_codon:yes gene_type:complete
MKEGIEKGTIAIFRVKEWAEELTYIMDVINENEVEVLDGIDIVIIGEKLPGYYDVYYTNDGELSHINSLSSLHIELKEKKDELQEM